MTPGKLLDFQVMEGPLDCSVILSTKSSLGCGFMNPCPEDQERAKDGMCKCKGGRTMTSRGVCLSNGISAFSVIFIIFSVSFVLYCAIGTAMNVRQRNVWEIPHKQWWHAQGSKVSSVFGGKGGSGTVGSSSYAEFGAVSKAPAPPSSFAPSEAQTNYDDL